MKRNLFTLICLLLAACLTAVILTACRRAAEVPAPTPESSAAPQPLASAQLPSLPDGLVMEDGVPLITVYNTANDSYETMNMERYVMGVLAGEMRNDWPMEALKAQAILARTFTLKFIDEKQSRYPGADISTDVTEAQAYDAEKINDRIERAVAETAGEVLSVNGELPYAWFHAHAGGVTELPTLALDYPEPDPSYAQVVISPDSDRAPGSVREWEAEFTVDEVARAARDSGADIDEITSIALGDKGASGRTVFFLINGQKVSAPSLRVHLDSTRLKSTLLDSVELDDDDGEISFEGRGYGHGVGMSQWGAYAMAEEGKKAAEIVSHYFRDVSVVRLW